MIARDDDKVIVLFDNSHYGLWPPMYIRKTIDTLYNLSSVPKTRDRFFFQLLLQITRGSPLYKYYSLGFQTFSTPCFIINSTIKEFGIQMIYTVIRENRHIMTALFPMPSCEKMLLSAMLPF
jgi:hypothetical protein